MNGFALKEKDVAAQVKSFLEWRGWRILRCNVTKVKDKAGRWTSFGEVGMADYLAVFYFPDNPLPAIAAVLWVEIKGPGGKLRPEQIVWHRDELARGGLVIVADQFEPFEKWYWETFEWLHNQQGQSHLFQRG